MLYDKRWDAPVKTDRFAAWLASKPAGRRYDYTNPANCPYAQYLRSYGIFAMVNPRFWIGLWLGVVPVAWIVPSRVNDALILSRTFGEATDAYR